MTRVDPPPLRVVGAPATGADGPPGTARGAVIFVDELGGLEVHAYEAAATVAALNLDIVTDVRFGPLV